MAFVFKFLWLLFSFLHTQMNQYKDTHQIGALNESVIQQIVF